MEITLKKDEKLTIKTPRGLIKVKMIDEEGFTTINCQLNKTKEGYCESVEVDMYSYGLKLSSFFKGGIKKISKITQKFNNSKWFDLSNPDIEQDWRKTFLTIFKTRV